MLAGLRWLAANDWSGLLPNGRPKLCGIGGGARATPEQRAQEPGGDQARLLAAVLALPS
jgi:hypothetical protein